MYSKLLDEDLAKGTIYRLITGHGSEPGCK